MRTWFLVTLTPASFLAVRCNWTSPQRKLRSAARSPEPLGLDLARAAWGIHEIINEDVARAFRIHASERGFDYRDSTMDAFGGSGPIHALAIARKLKIPRAIFPIGAGVMSALGLLVSPLSFELARSHRTFLEDLDVERFEAIFAPIVDEASGFLRRAGIVDGDIRITRRLDMRYQGQGYEIEVPLPNSGEPETVFDDLTNLFETEYERVFSASHLDEALEIINWKVDATGPDVTLQAGYSLTSAGSEHADSNLHKGTRPAYFADSGGYIDCPTYNRYAFSPGTEITGPALIEERESTCVIGVGDTAIVDANYNLIVELSV